MKRSATQLEERLALPRNATLRKLNFSLKDLSGVELQDMDLLTLVISHCAHHIAQKHQQVQVHILQHKQSCLGVKLLKYTVQMQMPAGVPLPDSHQTTGLHLLAKTLIVDPILTTLLPTEEGGAVYDGAYVLEVPVYSHKNPFAIAYSSVTHIAIKELVLVSPPPDCEGSAVKRPRKSSAGAS